MSNLRPENSWSMHWRPPEEHRMRRQFELLNGGPDDHSGLGRPTAHSYHQFHQPLSHGPASRSGYHLTFDGDSLASALPVPARKRRREPRDVDDTFAEMDFDVSAGYEVGAECLGEPRNYVDQTGDILEEGNGKRRRLASHTVRFIFFVGEYFMLTQS